MNLGKQIDSVLRRQAAVYVKGLGVFRRIHTSATFDPKSNAFLPPISFIEFDASSEDGFDFVTYLQQTTAVERVDAEKIVEQEVTDLANRIASQGEANLDNIGTLLSFDGVYVFKPLDLSGFLYTPVENEYIDTISHPLEATEVPENIFADDVEHVEEARVEEKITTSEEPLFKAEMIDVNRGIIEEEPTIKEENNSYIYGLVAAVAILVLGGVYFYISVYHNNEVVERGFTFDSSVMDSVENELDTTESPMVLDEDSTITIQDTIVPIAQVPEELPQTKEKPATVDYKYTIVIGTHATMEQANDEVSSYHKKGHKTVRALAPNLSKNKTRVVWDVYKTVEERDAALREVRKNVKSDAWGSEI